MHVSYRRSENKIVIIPNNNYYEHMPYNLLNSSSTSEKVPYFENGKYIKDKRMRGIKFLCCIDNIERIKYEPWFILPDPKMNKKMFLLYKIQKHKHVETGKDTKLFHTWDLESCKEIARRIVRNKIYEDKWDLFKDAAGEKYKEFPIKEYRKPYSYQRKGSWIIANFPEVALLWEMGTGKTQAVVDGFRIRKQKKTIKRMLVIAPLTICENWVEEIEKIDPTLKVGLAQGTSKDKLDILESYYHYDVIVMNYDGVNNDDIYNQIDYFLDDNWMLVLDESTRIKNPGTRRTQRFLSLQSNTQYKIIMTGTPISKHGYDIILPYKFLSTSDIFPQSYKGEMSKYYWINGNKINPKFHTKKKFSEIMYSRGSRVLLSECVELPKKIYRAKTVTFKPNSDAAKAYDSMLSQFIAKIEKEKEYGEITAPIILTQMLRFMQITSGFASMERPGEKFASIYEFDDKPKLEKLSELIDDIGLGSNGTQGIIWSRFTYEIDMIAKLLDKKDIVYGIIDGRTKVDERKYIRQNFQGEIKVKEEKKIKVIIGNPVAGGEGINLTKAQYMVYMSNDYPYRTRKQSEARMYRRGLDHPCVIIDIMVKDSFDMVVYQMLREGKDISDAICLDKIQDFLVGIDNEHIRSKK